MKKNLLATTALVAAGVLASQGAFAESKPISLKVGGYMEQWVGVASYDPSTGADVTDVDVQQDAEIHFSGSTTLDNGLKRLLEPRTPARSLPQPPQRVSGHRETGFEAERFAVVTLGHIDLAS